MVARKNNAPQMEFPQKNLALLAALAVALIGFGLAYYYLQPSQPLEPAENPCAPFPFKIQDLNCASKKENPAEIRFCSPDGSVSARSTTVTYKGEQVSSKLIKLSFNNPQDRLSCLENVRNLGAEGKSETFQLQGRQFNYFQVELENEPVFQAAYYVSENGDFVAFDSSSRTGKAYFTKEQLAQALIALEVFLE